MPTWSGSTVTAVWTLRSRRRCGPGFRPDAGVWCLAVQADGKVLAGGSVDRWLGRLERLNSDGSLDTGFNAPVVGSSSFWPAVNTLVVQADGKILVGGSFTSLGNQACTNLGVANADGTVDGGFVGPVFYRDGEIGEVDSLALQADGKIVAGGYFTQLDGQSQTNLGRLNPDGSLDRGFISGASGPVYAVALQGDGSVLVGGLFTNLCGQARTNLWPAQRHRRGGAEPDSERGRAQLDARRQLSGSAVGAV